MITDLLMTGAGLPFTKRNGMMVVKKFADCPQEMDFNSNADNLYHDHKMLRRIAQPSTEHYTALVPAGKGSYRNVFDSPALFLMGTHLDHNELR